MSGMMLIGTNSLTSVGKFPAIYVGPDNVLTILEQSDGTLFANGSGTASGIGGSGLGSGLSPDSGWIEIEGGTVVATSESGGAAIGAGMGGKTEKPISIKGGTVTATGSNGYGLYADGAVTINGGTIEATGTGDNAAIYAYSGDITLTNATDTATAANTYAVYANSGKLTNSGGT